MEPETTPEAVLMEHKIDKPLVRVSGWMYIDRKLKPEQDVRVVIEGTVDEEKVKPNYDGSVNLHWVVKASPATAKVETL